jgi:hypothetical protein
MNSRDMSDFGNVDVTLGLTYGNVPLGFSIPEFFQGDAESPL